MFSSGNNYIRMMMMMGCSARPLSSYVSTIMVLGLLLLVAAWAPEPGSTAAAEAAAGSTSTSKKDQRYVPIEPALGGLRYQTTVYFHNVINSTEFVIVSGVPGNAEFSTTTAPFGLVFCANDPLTLSASSSSEDVVGALMGTFTCVTFDGLTYHSLFTLSFDESDLFPFAGTLSVQGLLQGNPSVPPIPAAVLGGSGSFFMAQGTASIIPVDISSFSQTFQIDLDLYLPTLSAAPASGDSEPGSLHTEL